MRVKTPNLSLATRRNPSERNGVFRARLYSLLGWSPGDDFSGASEHVAGAPEVVLFHGIETHLPNGMAINALICFTSVAAIFDPIIAKAG